MARLIRRGSAALVHLCAWGALGALAGASQAPSNDAPLHNGGDVVFIYSSPSVGAPPGAGPDLTGDLYWRAHSGEGFLANVDPSGAAVMEIDGYYEWLWDTDWSTSPWFYTRMHGPALPDGGGLGGLEPAFFQLGLTSEVIVQVGPSGFGSPCTVAPSLCSPSGGSCPPIGFLTGYLVDLQFGSTPGSGVVVPADGTAASDLASVWFIHGGMTATGGTCGLGDYDLQDRHSTDESQADASGNGINPYGGFQIAGSGPMLEASSSMAASVETWRGPILNPQADTGTGWGVELGDNGGGALNARELDVSSGWASLGVELRDAEGAASASSLGVVAASLTPLPVPGVPLLGANLLVQSGGGVFDASTSLWQGPVVPTTFVFTSEGAYTGLQAPLSPLLAGTAFYLQGLVLDLATLQGRSTNRVRVRLH